MGKSRAVAVSLAGTRDDALLSVELRQRCAAYGLSGAGSFAATARAWGGETWLPTAPCQV